MKKLLFACILSIGVFQSQAQVFLCEPEVLKGVESLPKYHEIVALLNKDVIHYYDLSSEYSSDLQKKVFQSSDEYKDLHASLSVAYDKAMGTKFYWAWSVSSISYDLEAKCLVCSRSWLKRYNGLGIQIDDRGHYANFLERQNNNYWYLIDGFSGYYRDVLFSIFGNVKVKLFDVPRGFGRELFLPLLDEQKALEIELVHKNENEGLVLVFVAYLHNFGNIHYRQGERKGLLPIAKRIVGYFMQQNTV